MPSSLIDLHHHKVLRKRGGYMLQKQTHHLRIGRGQNERGHFARELALPPHRRECIRARFAVALEAALQAVPRHVSGYSCDRSGPHLRPSLALVAGRQDRVWPVLLEPPAQSFFKSGLLFWIGFGMARTRHELAPAVTIQQTIDARDMHFMLDLPIKGALNFFRRGNFSLCGSREKGLQKAAFLLHAHVFMTASPFAWRFNRGKSQAAIAGNDAAHRRDRQPCISGDLFGFARAHQGVVNDPPAFSNPRAWIHFHATFDCFHWKMSSGSCDSRSQNRSSSLPSSFPLLYHSERKLVSNLIRSQLGGALLDGFASGCQRRSPTSAFRFSSSRGSCLGPRLLRSPDPYYSCRFFLSLGE